MHVMQEKADEQVLQILGQTRIEFILYCNKLLLMTHNILDYINKNYLSVILFLSKLNNEMQ